VTGGAGFIGGNLCRRLLSENIGEVAVLDDLSTGRIEHLTGLPVRFVEGSILDEDLLARMTRGVDAVVHLAARPSVPRSIAEPLASHETNATGTLHVLEAARHEQAYVVVASSSSVYGRNPALPKHEDLATMPASPYAVSKLATEGYALAYAASFGLRTLAFRFFNVYGPLQEPGHAYAAVVPQFISAALDGRPATVHGDGLQTRDFTYVDSVTSVLSAAALHRVTHDRPVNLAFGTRCDLVHVLDELGVILGRPIPRHHVPARPGDVRDSQADQAPLRQLFPSARPTSLREGLQRTVQWFRQQRAAHPASTPGPTTTVPSETAGGRT
jgi:UDP-glucose 4-epimerase